MATSSIYKNITIKSRHSGRSLLRALEKAQSHPGKEPVLTKKVTDLLGHSSIETTRIYLLSTGAEHARQLEGLGLVQ